MTTILAILVAPIILAVVNHLLTRAAKREDWKRQDEVAAKVDLAAKAAEAARVQVEEAASLLLESDERRAMEDQRRADADAHTHGQLETIHHQLDGEMTERIRAQLRTTETTLLSLKALMAHRSISGIPPTDEEHAAIDLTERQIAELNIQLADREALKEGGG